MKPKNAQQYRKPPIKRTQVSFFDDTARESFHRPELIDGRSTQIRRDKDNVQDLSVTLYDIDYAIESFIRNTIQPKVKENGQWIDVPVMYANSEKWKSILNDGYMRDDKGKLFAPVIVYRRTSVAVDDTLKKNRVAPLDSYGYLMKKTNSAFTPYDKFSILTNQRQPVEYYTTVVPEYVKVQYDFKIWCQFQSQLNSVVEDFVLWQGKAFGDENHYKFTSVANDYSFELINNTGEDRAVRGTFTLSANGYLIAKETSKEVLMKRSVSVREVRFGESIVDNFDSNGNSTTIGQKRSGDLSPNVYPKDV